LLLFLVCCLGALAVPELELRTNYVVVHSGPEKGVEHISHLPDESNFQASGGAALGSFGGFTRVIVLLVVLLGVLYHGFVPAAIFGAEAVVRPATASLPVRKLSDSQREDLVSDLVRTTVQAKPLVAEIVEVVSPSFPASVEIKNEVSQKISKQAVKKMAKKAARRLLEASKPVEEKAAPTEKVVLVTEKKKISKETIAEDGDIAPRVQENNLQEKEQEVVVVAKEVKEEERQEELKVEKHGWELSPPKPFERTSVTIKRAKRMFSIHQLLSVRQHRASSDIVEDLDLGSFVVDPRTVNCPVFMKMAAAPLLLEETSPLDIAEQDTPASIEPVRDKIVAPPVVQEFVPKKVTELAPPKAGILRDWAFNSHKKTAWVQPHARGLWTNDALAMPDFMSFGMPWSPIRTPCKFASACKKPGCQFTHPTVPAWLPAPVF